MQKSPASSLVASPKACPANPDEASPFPASDEASPFSASDEVSPFPASDEASPFHVSDEVSPFSASDEASPFPVSDEVSPFSASDEASPFPASDEASPFPASDEVSPCSEPSSPVVQDLMACYRRWFCHGQLLGPTDTATDFCKSACCDPAELTALWLARLHPDEHARARLLLQQITQIAALHHVHFGFESADGLGNLDNFGHAQIVLWLSVPDADRLTSRAKTSGPFDIAQPICVETEVTDLLGPDISSKLACLKVFEKHRGARDPVAFLQHVLQLLLQP